jgi:hypothetical protein
MGKNHTYEDNHVGRRRGFMPAATQGQIRRKDSL